MRNRFNPATTKKTPYNKPTVIGGVTFTPGSEVFLLSDGCSTETILRAMGDAAAVARSMPSIEAIPVQASNGEQIALRKDIFGSGRWEWLDERALVKKRYHVRRETVEKEYAISVALLRSRFLPKAQEMLAEAEARLRGAQSAREQALAIIEALENGSHPALQERQS